MSEVLTRVFSAEQEQVIQTWGKGISVLAGAGSGKTTTLVEKCHELFRKNPNAQFAAVSFTERSTSDLKVKLSQSNQNAQLVMTIHGLCAAILRDFPREAGFDGEEEMLSGSEAELLWDKVLESLWMLDLPPSLQKSLDFLLQRETLSSLGDLFNRVRELSLFGVLESLQDQSDLGARALFEISEYLLKKYQLLKKRRGVMDFQDLEWGARKILENPKIRKFYHQKYDLVLIDEFQDTNPIQAEILWSIVKPDLSNLCVVGDPKQSIYRFRDADVSVFKEYTSRLPVQISLNKNYRSRPEILDFVNQVCQAPFRESGQIYEPLIPHRDSALDGESSSVQKIEVESEEDLVQWIKKEQGRGVQLDQITLLLRKIRGAEKWIKALSSAGIPIAVGSGGLFWEDPRVRELVAFLKWWDQPQNALSGAVFLRAPWVGVPDLVLDEWVVKDPTWIKAFFDSDLEHFSVPETVKTLSKKLHPYYEKKIRPGELLLELLEILEIEEELGTQLLGLWHRAEELSYRGLSFSEIVHKFSIAIAENRREREIPPPRNLGQLLVLTIHGSKGLEFENVILLDFPEKPQRAANAPLLFWDRNQGAYFSKRDLDGERMPQDPQENILRKEENKKNLAESMRLFYVALTRAKERLVLIMPKSNENIELENKSGEKNVYTQDFWRGWIEEVC